PEYAATAVSAIGGTAETGNVKRQYRDRATIAAHSGTAGRATVAAFSASTATIAAEPATTAAQCASGFYINEAGAVFADIALAGSNFHNSAVAAGPSNGGGSAIATDTGSGASV